jgi:hypothetical protein
MMPITTSSSTRVNPLRRFMINPFCDRMCQQM